MEIGFTSLRSFTLFGFDRYTADDLGGGWDAAVRKYAWTLTVFGIEFRRLRSQPL